MASNSNKMQAVLIVFVALLAAHNIYLSHRISSLSEKAEIDWLRVRIIDLVQPSGKVSGTLYAGNEGSSPEIKLVEKDKGNSFRMGFAGGTGPVLEMLTDFNTADGPDTRILLGSLINNADVSGLQITGRNATEWPPITLGWITQRATTKPHRYVYSIPGDPFMDIETIK